MKDSLFELLLDLFEKTITQLQERYPLAIPSEPEVEASSVGLVAPVIGQKATLQMALIQSASQGSFRVLSPDERMRLTKSSYQLLERMSSWGIVSSDVMELILNRLMFSDSRFIQLQETKWTIRSTLAPTLDSEQLAFLDLVLYQKENGLAIH
jgi:uncharacterized protein Smg (DUF494 family)